MSTVGLGLLDRISGACHMMGVGGRKAFCACICLTSIIRTCKGKREVTSDAQTAQTKLWQVAPYLNYS